MTCEEVEQLVDLYSLNALTIDEAEDVELHLETCANCRAAMADAWQTARALRVAVPQVAPPASLHERLMSEVRQEVPAVSPRTYLEPVPIRPAQRGWLSWLTAPRVAAVAAAIPMVLSLWLTSQVLQMRAQLDVAETRMVNNFQNGVFAADILGRVVETGGASVPLQGQGPASAASGKLYFTSERNEGVLVVNGLPKLTRDKIYQLWLQRSDDTMNAGTFYCEETGRGMMVVRAPMPLTQFEAVRVTNEPTGGSDQPKGPSYMWGRVRGA
jgi:anti-sigma-K factor RskA